MKTILGKPAINGMIIEQRPILTTHNLAVLHVARVARDFRRSAYNTLIEYNRGPVGRWANEKRAGLR